jgi:hypothetical protein
MSTITARKTSRDEVEFWELVDVNGNAYSELRSINDVVAYAMAWGFQLSFEKGSRI